MTDTYSAQRWLQLFGATATRSAIVAAEKAGRIPPAERLQTGAYAKRVWPLRLLPQIGETFGMLRKPARTTVVTVFSAKGGVFKTSLAFNFARLSALHNIRTCVIGLDFQSDITRRLYQDEIQEEEEGKSVQELIDAANRYVGLHEVLHDNDSIETALVESDIPTLSFVPETAKLITLDRWLSGEARREYVFTDRLVADLRKQFDLIIFDCPPGWNHLVSNAITAADAVISPLECRAGQFGSLSVFKSHLDDFRKQMRLTHQQFYVPTRLARNRRLSMDIRRWYADELNGTTLSAVRETAAGEEAMMMNLSLPEYKPASPYADEMRELIREIWERLPSVSTASDAPERIAS